VTSTNPAAPARIALTRDQDIDNLQEHSGRAYVTTAPDTGGERADER
jgi:hypothetical protein